ncbi:Ada metal-binding domain-containing protein [uncultured Lactobacillus sp.]|uniref:sunset domain-containing protein n=1 Tax=uncultured Lactobacillus sp. TaxID=153152 RepID=UPI002636275C|nr:Ada metal-binding domain-containing protein [uncultured Lactobacillus sp.]
MKKCKNLLMTIVVLLTLVGEISVIPANLQSSSQLVNATVYRKKRRRKQHDKTKIWTSEYKIVGNKRSKIFHVMRGHNYRMNRENAIFFKSKAAARAAGYRESRR